MDVSSKTLACHQYLVTGSESSSQQDEVGNKESALPADTELEWDGPSDPDNPRNWPQWQRVFGTAIPALQLLAISMAVSTYVPAMPAIKYRFQISDQIANLGLSLFLLGVGIGPLPIAPLSELFGRQPVFRYGLPILIIFTIGSATAQNIETFLVCRTLGSFLGSGALAVIGGSVLDIWDMKKGGGLAACCATLTPLLGPVLGPVAGAYIIAEYNNNWRYAMWVVVFVGAPIVVLSFFLKESYKPQILKVRAKRRGIAVRSTGSRMEALTYVLQIAFTRPTHMLLTEPLVLLPSFYGGFTYFLLISFFGSYPYIFVSIFHFSPKSTSLAFLSVMVGLILGMAVFIVCEAGVKKKATAGNARALAPEAHLIPALIGSVLLPISLFWLAWTSTAAVHWIAPVLAGAAFGAAMVMIYFTVIVYMAYIYPPSVSASSLAAVGLLRYLMSALPPHFVTPMYQHLGAQWAGSVFAFISLALLPLPWAFWKWGKALRLKSKYDTSRL